MCFCDTAWFVFRAGYSKTIRETLESMDNARIQRLFAAGNRFLKTLFSPDDTPATLLARAPRRKPWTTKKKRIKQPVRYRR